MIVGVKSGTFRIIHAGHIWMFEQCKKHCDHLIVLTNDDEYIQNHKGRIFTPMEERIAVLNGIKFIDEVHWFSGHSEEFWIGDFKQQRLYQEFGQDAFLRVFHSAELQGITQPPAWSIADDIMFINRIPGSTTNIVKNIRGR